jgi:hypothetical protein
MNINIDVEATIDEDLNFDEGTVGFKSADNIKNNKLLMKTPKQKYLIRQRLDYFCEKRFLDRQLNSLSDDWDI